MNDRIILAKMMGWKYKYSKPIFDHTEDIIKYLGENYFWESPLGIEVQSAYTMEDCLPDPFTDVTDDYLVNQWACNGFEPYPGTDFFLAYRKNLRGCGSSGGMIIDYKVGECAYAALKAQKDKSAALKVLHDSSRSKKARIKEGKGLV